MLSWSKVFGCVTESQPLLYFMSILLFAWDQIRQLCMLINRVQASDFEIDWLQHQYQNLLIYLVQLQPKLVCCHLPSCQINRVVANEQEPFLLLSTPVLLPASKRTTQFNKFTWKHYNLVDICNLNTFTFLGFSLLFFLMNWLSIGKQLLENELFWANVSSNEWWSRLRYPWSYHKPVWFFIVVLKWHSFHHEICLEGLDEVFFFYFLKSPKT